MKVEVVDTHSPHLPTIKALGRANASTLGFLPEGAFDQYALSAQSSLQLIQTVSALGIYYIELLRVR
jgi:hypothetical protein